MQKERPDERGPSFSDMLRDLRPTDILMLEELFLLTSRKNEVPSPLKLTGQDRKFLRIIKILTD